jgi:hypothetical protein
MLSLQLLILTIPQLVSSHSWLLSPKSRFDDNCIPAFQQSNCCISKPNSVSQVYQRGEKVPTSWGRNNHIGGYIRWSIVPLSQSDDFGIFDQTVNAFQYNCFSPDCTGSDGDFFAGDPAGSPENGNLCSINITIPIWLPDGEYTIQWHWHSSGDSFNIRNLGLVDFVSCHDFKVSGGPMQSKPQCPLYVAGDSSNPNLNTCEFFKYNDINTCTDEHNCFSWFAKAPPKAIMQCPYNVKNILHQDVPGTALPLFIGESQHPNNNPDPQNTVDLNVIKRQLTSTPVTSTSVTSTPVTSTSVTSTSVTSTSIASTSVTSTSVTPRSAPSSSVCKKRYKTKCKKCKHHVKVT